MTHFPQDVVAAVLNHMNDDHQADSLTIARAFGYPEASSATMTGFDTEAGFWNVIDPEGAHDLRVSWPGGSISTRAEIRREVVAAFNEARQELGSFAKQIRETSWSQHGQAEGQSFMTDIMKGKATLADYAALVAQHFFIYDALETATKSFAEHPQLARFDSPQLHRLAALDEDLSFLVGKNWREVIAPLPATASYAERISEVARDGAVEKLIAHHYTRYLGDVSGGQIVARGVKKQHGLGEAGVAFYDFSELGDLKAFKEQYRAELDTLGWALTASGRERFIAEVGVAYRFNSEVFEDLARQKTEQHLGQR